VVGRQVPRLSCFPRPRCRSTRLQIGHFIARRVTLYAREDGQGPCQRVGTGVSAMQSYAAEKSGVHAL
jgi:hypothetical protein